jgi:hypothetical protein
LVTDTYKQKVGVCKVTTPNAEGRAVECGKTYSNPSTTTMDDHLVKHVHLPEFVGKKMLQTKLGDYVGFTGWKSFKNLAVCLVVNNNLAFNLLESPEWIYLCKNHLMVDKFGSHAATAHLKKLVDDGKESFAKFLETLPFYSISEDEGSINSECKVLHNLHYVDPKDLSVQTTFLRYFTSKNKEEDTLVGHWNKTFGDWKIDRKKLSGFSSDQALHYVPKGLNLCHVPCGTHLLDLCLEDNYIYIKEEVDKSVAVRQYITTHSEIRQLYADEQVACGLTVRAVPINSMIRFVTYEEVFQHLSTNSDPINRVLEEKKQDLVIKDSEILTYRTLCEVFAVIRDCMKTLQVHPISHYLPCMWGALYNLELLLKKDSFAASDGLSTGQYLFTTGVMDTIKLRLTDTQLKDKQRDLLVRAMLLDPFTKKSLGNEFPAICRQTRIAAQKKELLLELTALIRKVRDVANVVEELEPEKPTKKKKVEPTNIFGFMTPPKEPIDKNAPISRDPEIKWFTEEYLAKDQICQDSDAGVWFWKQNSKTYPSCFQLVIKYRSILCTSIFEEQCFSNVDKIMTDSRGSLLDDTVQMIMFLKKNVRFVFPPKEGDDKMVDSIDID